MKTNHGQKREPGRTCDMKTSLGQKRESENMGTHRFEGVEILIGFEGVKDDTAALGACVLVWLLVLTPGSLV
jgi:hypothetical protein